MPSFVSSFNMGNIIFAIFFLSRAISPTHLCVSIIVCKQTTLEIPERQGRSNLHEKHCYGFLHDTLLICVQPGT